MPARKGERERGLCGTCGRSWIIRDDGKLRTHRKGSHRGSPQCEGSLCDPIRKLRDDDVERP